MTEDLSPIDLTPDDARRLADLLDRSGPPQPPPGPPAGGDCQPEEAVLRALRAAAGLRDGRAAEGPGAAETAPAGPPAGARAGPPDRAESDSPAPAAERRDVPDDAGTLRGWSDEASHGPARPAAGAAARITVVQGDLIQAANYYGRILDRPNATAVRGGQVEDLL